MRDATITDARLGSPSPALAALTRGLADGAVLAERYRVTRFIAAGGIGEVYEAHDVVLGDRVAVKLLRPELSGKPGAQQRFADEIRTARRITHPNVCRVFDVGFDGDRFFYTMELHPGETLATRIRAHAPLSIDDAKPIVRQLLAGVGAAHAAEVVHMDLKPSNVLLENGRVVVTDFGLAVPMCATIGCYCAMPHLIGTPAYMAPEQVTGGTLLEGTDIYSIGVILYEMLTGDLPWTGGTARELAHARLLGAPPSPRARRPDLDPVWDDTIRACLALDIKARPRSVGELASALRLA